MFKRFFRKRFDRAIGSLINEIFLRGFGQPIFNKINTANLIKEGYQGNADVYSVINYISTIASNIEWTLSEIKDEKALISLKNSEEWDAKTMTLEKKALEQITSHPVLDVWNNPNQLQTRSEFIYNWCGFKLITGNAFINGVAPAIGKNKGLFQELFIMPSQFIEIIPGNIREPIKKYIINIGAKTLKFDPEVVNHSKYFNPDFRDGQSLFGMSPLQAAFRTLQSSNDADTARVRAYQNQGAIGMISAGSNEEKMKMSSEELKSLSDKYQEKFGGVDNFNKVLFTTAMAKWDNMGLSPVDLAIIESKLSDFRTLCRVYNFPSQILNDPEGTTFNNMKEAKKAAITDAVMPLLNSLRDELNGWLVANYSKAEGRKLFISPDWKSVAVLQEDIQKLVNWLARAWWLTPNKKLEIQGIETSKAPGMDKIYIPTNLEELEKHNAAPSQSS
ncbi:MAG: phage portal protein [Candidatus Anammoxibacter sp.]